MQKNSLVFSFQWGSCRQTPFLGRKDIVKSLSLYFSDLFATGKLGEWDVMGWDTPSSHEIEITVKVDDLHLSPAQIFWAISRDSAAYLEREFPELSRLPSIWTRKFSVRTKGKA